MCTRVRYRGQILDQREAGAQLPVLRRDGSVAWLPWGATRGDPSTPFIWGATARQGEAVKWARFNARKVRLPIEAIEMRDPGGRDYWLALPERHLLRGLVATVGPERRVYLVVDTTTGWQRNWVNRWPVLLKPLGTGTGYTETTFYPSLLEMAPHYERLPQYT